MVSGRGVAYLKTSLEPPSLQDLIKRKIVTDHRMHPRAKISPETCKFRRHGCPLAKSCQCQTHSINLHVRGVSDVARTVIRSNTCMDETDEAAGRGSEAEKPPGADLPSIARGDTPGHERDTARAVPLPWRGDACPRDQLSLVSTLKTASKGIWGVSD